MNWLKTSLLFLLGSAPVWANTSKYNMRPGVTPVSQEIYSLHMLVFWIATAIAVIVFGVLIYSLIKHRKSKGVKPSNFHGNTTIEIVWAIIPFIILIAMAIPATKVILDIHKTEDPDVTIQVTGYQWYWHYDYLDYGIDFFSRLSTPLAQMQNKEEKGEWYLLEVDNELVVPANKKIRFVLTSNDVIHSFWVPDLGGKRDTLPGFITESWAYILKPGTYRGQCAELCGQGHGFMPIVVRALPENEFEDWVNRMQSGELESKDDPTEVLTVAELTSVGESKYNGICAVCHQVSGAGLGAAFPALKGAEIVTDDAKRAELIDIVLHGRSGTAMQAFGAQLSDKDIAAILTYVRDSWGNEDAFNSNDLAIQAYEVGAARAGLSVEEYLAEQQLDDNENEEDTE